MKQKAIERHPSDTFEIHGYFVEYLDFDTYECYGYQVIPDQGDWQLGYAGKRLEKLTAPVTLTKGTKQVVLKASENRPIVVTKMCHAMCGRMHKDIHSGGV